MLFGNPLLLDAEHLLFPFLARRLSVPHVAMITRPALHEDRDGLTDKEWDGYLILVDDLLDLTVASQDPDLDPALCEDDLLFSEPAFE